MSVFAIKLMTLLGYVLSAGGPIDAVFLAMEGEKHFSASPQCVVGCEMATRVIAVPVRTATLLPRSARSSAELRSTLGDNAVETGSGNGEKAGVIK